MAATVAIVDQLITGGFVKVQEATVTGDASYPTGGYSITAAQLGFPGGIDWAIATVQQPGGAAVIANYSVTNAKLQLFTSAAEVANATNVATCVVQIIARGGY